MKESMLAKNLNRKRRCKLQRFWGVELLKLYSLYSLFSTAFSMDNHSRSVEIKEERSDEDEIEKY